jgi:hypothetical protein
MSTQKRRQSTKIIRSNAEGDALQATPGSGDSRALKGKGFSHNPSFCTVLFSHNRRSNVETTQPRSHSQARRPFPREVLNTAVNGSGWSLTSKDARRGGETVLFRQINIAHVLAEWASPRIPSPTLGSCLPADDEEEPRGRRDAHGCEIHQRDRQM